MRSPYPFNQITPPDPEARGDWPPLPPRYQPTMSEMVPSWGMPSNFNDTRRWLPSWRGIIEFHEGPLSGRSNVDCRTGTSNEMKVCRQFQRWRKCAYGDQCRFFHEIPEKTRNFGSSSQNYEVRAVPSGHVMDRRSGFDRLEEVRSKVQTKIVARGEIPKPASCKARPCYPWQTTGHCPYGEACRFAHGEAEQQKLESCSASERGSVGGASATTSAAATAGLRSSRGIGTDCKNKGPRMKQFFKSKELKKLIGIYADWLEN